MKGATADAANKVVLIWRRVETALVAALKFDLINALHWFEFDADLLHNVEFEHKRSVSIRVVVYVLWFLCTDNESYCETVPVPPCPCTTQHIRKLEKNVQSYLCADPCWA